MTISADMTDGELTAVWWKACNDDETMTGADMNAKYVELWNNRTELRKDAIRVFMLNHDFDDTFVLTDWLGKVFEEVMPSAIDAMYLNLPK